MTRDLVRYTGPKSTGTSIRRRRSLSPRQRAVLASMGRISDGVFSGAGYFCAALTAAILLHAFGVWS